MYGDEHELALVRERARAGARGWKLVFAALGGLLLLGVGLLTLVIVLGRASNRERRTRLQEVADRVEREQETWNKEHPHPSATVTEAPTPAADVGPQVDAEASGRALLLKLSRNPTAVKPTKISPPDGLEPHTTYEYKTDELGEVIQWRTTTRAWSIFLAGRFQPEVIALQSEIKELDHVGIVQWWRITDGPLRTNFVMKSGGGIELVSLGQACDHKPPANSPTPRVDRECGWSSP